MLANSEYSQLPTPGFSKCGVSFALSITDEGELWNIIDLRSDEQNHPPQVMDVPYQSGRTSGIYPYFICDKSGYLLAFEKDIKQKRLKDQFQASKELHASILSGAKGPVARSILRFFNRWDPDSAKDNELLNERIGGIKGAICTFMVSGYDGFAHDDPEVKRLWLHRYNRDIGDDTKEMVCMVTNEVAKIPRIHTPISGLKSANAKLVCFDKYSPSFSSYGKTESFNAPISLDCMIRYTSVLNCLLSDPHHHISIENEVYVFWAEKRGIEEDIVAELFGFTTPKGENDAPIKDTSNTRKVRDILRKIRNGTLLSDIDETIDENTRLFILLISPNISRIAVKSWHVNTFGNIIRLWNEYLSDIEIVGMNDIISFETICKETIPPKSKKRKEIKEKGCSPRIKSGLLSAAVNGTPFPVELYYALIKRIRADGKINDVRAGVIKGFLTRAHKDNGGISVRLDKKNDDTAYILGRLFAILEKVQKDSTKGNIKSTIKDRYFSSASATPSTIYPILLKLSNHHIAKLDKGLAIYYEQQITDLLSRISDFPTRQSLEEQGRFIIGYYHQEKEFYTKKEE